MPRRAFCFASFAPFLSLEHWRMTAQNTYEFMQVNVAEWLTHSPLNLENRLRAAAEVVLPFFFFFALLNISKII